MNKKVLTGVIILAIVGLVGYRIISFKTKGKKVEAQTIVPVYVKKIATGSIQNSISASGNITASQQADIFSRVPGKLISNLVDEGDRVTDNQEIALIDRDEVGVSFTTATVKSTISGILLKRYADPGTRINPAMPIATVGDISKVKAVINIAENDFTKVRKGMKVYIIVDAYPGRKFTGNVTLVSPSIDLMSRTGKIEVLIDNQDGNLKPGMFASVEIVVSVHPGAITVPLDTIIEDNNKKVFVVENGKAVERLVSTGLSDDANVEVLSGLKPGEELIVGGQHKVKNGDEVKIITE